MKCKFCGHEVEEGKVFCSSCGKEIQFVPDYNAFEDDLLREIMSEDNSQKEPMNSQAKKDKEELVKQHKIQKQNEEKKKKKIILISCASAVAVILIFVICLAIILTNKNRNNSFDYQYDKGQSAYDSSNYKEAIEYLERATTLDKTDLDSRYMLLDCYLQTKNYDSALVLCQEIIRIDAKNDKAYKTMIEIYDSRNDMDSIVALSKDVKDEKILNLFSEYMITMPIIKFNLEKNKSGGFDEPVTFSLSSAGNNEILFTIDGKDPMEKGIRYTEPVVLTEPGKYVIKAVCKNSKGLYSEMLIEEVDLSFKNPTVEITPDGGDVNNAGVTVLVTLDEECEEAYYSWDGTDPDPEAGIGTLYSGPITIPEGNNVLTVVVYNTVTKLSSDPYRANFTYYPNK